MSTEEDLVEVTVKVPVTVTVLCPRDLAEDSDRDDLREIVDAAIQRDHVVFVHYKAAEVKCTIAANWDSLPEDEMEDISTECGSWESC